jgi:hypothetical protein
MDLKYDVICGIHTSKESCWICEVFQCCSQVFRNDFEAVRMIRVKPEEFMGRMFQGEINLV